MSAIAKQLLSDARRGIINRDKLLEKCIQMIDENSSEELYEMALAEGFINVQNEVDETLEMELSKLDTTQRIIEKVLSRHGE